MPPLPDEALTRLLHDWSQGDADALPRLMEIVYPELHRIAANYLRGERAGHTLQPTALVHEAYMRLANRRSERPWNDRTHFFAVAARIVRSILVDHARARVTVKRGEGAERVEIEDDHALVAPLQVDLLDLDAALVELEAMNPQHSRIVELRYFAGLSIEETAEAMHTSISTVKRGWLMSKSWIRRRLDGHTGEP